MKRLRTGEEARALLLLKRCPGSLRVLLRLISWKNSWLVLDLWFVSWEDINSSWAHIWSSVGGMLYTLILLVNVLELIFTARASRHIKIISTTSYRDQIIAGTATEEILHHAQINCKERVPLCRAVFGMYFWSTPCLFLEDKFYLKYFSHAYNFTHRSRGGADGADRESGWRCPTIKQFLRTHLSPRVWMWMI